MLVHKWEHADGTIVEARSGHGGATTAQPAEHHYVIDARRPNGELVRGHVAVQSIFAHQVGQVVRVEVNSRTNEIRLDPSARAEPVTDPANMADRRSSLIGDLTPGAPVAPGGIGSAGQQAAMERIRQRVAERSGQPGAAPAAANTGLPGPAAPSTFDPIGPASAAGAFEDPVRETFNQPAAPSSFGHVAEPPSFGAPAAFDQLGGAGTQEQQLAKLQQLFDKGILTESELAAQRQQVLNGG